MTVFTNVSAYKFTPLERLPALRERLLQTAVRLELKGTVLLSSEGINVFVAGRPADTAAFVACLRSIPGLENLTPRESESDDRPYGRMRVKIKKEIISFGVGGIDPARQPSPKLSQASTSTPR